MPNRYSHSVVLAHYASMGIIDYPNGPDIDFRSSAPQRGRAPSSARDSLHTGSSRESTYSTSSNCQSKTPSVPTLRSQTVQTPKSHSSTKPAVRLQRSNDLLQQFVDPSRKPLVPVEFSPAENNPNPSRSTIVLPSIVSSTELPQSAKRHKADATEDYHEVCLEMKTCSINCFQPPLSHMPSELCGPNLPRVSASNTTPLTVPKSMVPIQARESLRVTTPPAPNRAIEKSSQPPSNVSALVNKHEPHRPSPTPPRPDSVGTQMFDPLPATVDADLSTTSSPTFPVLPNVLDRHFSFDSLSSLSSLSSMTTDVPTCTATSKAPLQLQIRYPKYNRRRSHSFWDNVASCGDTVALSFAPAISTNTSTSDLSSYPPDIPVGRQAYVQVNPRSTPAIRHSLRRQMLTSPPSIPLQGQRMPLDQYQGKKNRFGVSSVLKKKNDGTVRNSGGMVIGARNL